MNSCAPKLGWRVVSLRGTEEISQPYAFEIQLFNDGPTLDHEELLGANDELLVERHGLTDPCSSSTATDTAPDDEHTRAGSASPKQWAWRLEHQRKDPMIGQHLRLPQAGAVLVALISLSACERENSSREGVEIVRHECHGYDPPSKHVDITVRAQRLDGSDPMRFLLTIKIMNGGTRPIPIADPYVLPSYVDPRSPADPSFEGRYPPVLLRVGEINSSGELAGEWTVLLPSSSPPVEPRNSTLDPGADIELSFPWMAPKPGHYTLQGISGEFGWQAHWATEPRCQGDVISPVCYAQAFAEFHFEVPPQ